MAERIAHRELNDTQFLLLWCCHRASNGGISQTDLAACVGVSAAQVSGLVDQLRRRQLLSAERCGDDRRRQLWKLTEAGDQLLQAALGDLDELAKRLDEQFSRRDHATIEQLLSRLTTATQDVPPLTVFDPDGDKSSCTNCHGGTAR